MHMMISIFLFVFSHLARLPPSLCLRIVGREKGSGDQELSATFIPQRESKTRNNKCTTFSKHTAAAWLTFQAGEKKQSVYLFSLKTRIVLRLYRNTHRLLCISVMKGVTQHTAIWKKTPTQSICRFNSLLSAAQRGSSSKSCRKNSIKMHSVRTLCEAKQYL